jgi:two-component system NtrC family sensor kinase
VWFLLFAIVPLAFLTGYSIVRYEKAIDKELARRLEGNAREMASMMQDFHTSLAARRDRVTSGSGFVYSLGTNQTDELSQDMANWLRSDMAAELSVFSRNGRLLFTQTKTATGEIRQLNPPAGSAIYISEENLKLMQANKDYSFIETNQRGRLSLILLSKILNSSGKIAGYTEQLIGVDREFLASIKSRLNVELILLRNNGSVVVSTHNDFYEYQKEFFTPFLEAKGATTFDMTVRSNPYEFILYPLQWGKTDFFIGIGASKGESRAILKGVNYAFYTVVGAVIVLLIVIILIISNSILRPLEDLVAAAQSLPYSDNLVEIPVKTDTEIGVLSESFNEMSRQILRIRSELKAKIAELEAANSEIKNAQTQLVHSSKMSSLGQLVAGVAHELNNPISFIYSNMTILKEYSEKLLELADAAEKDPETLGRLKQELDVDYIRQDLPKLVASCEDGARRVRDIVLGLRNFSRLEEAKLKEMNVHESLDNTLQLLSGEIKNRIEVVKNYGEIPPVLCYASQMNQVFMNILSNAAQAIRGPGHIWISTRTELTKDGQPGVAISIQDSGAGIEPKDLDKIYDPFFSTKGVGQGTGLGLSITYGIIQNHGGEIVVKSELQKGTEFTIVVPVRPDLSRMDKPLTTTETIEQT